MPLVNERCFYTALVLQLMLLAANRVRATPSAPVLNVTCSCVRQVSVVFNLAKMQIHTKFSSFRRTA